MPSVGDPAPAFTLPGVTDCAASTFDLERATERGNAVVLLFYPFDFSPVCTSELCSLRDGAFFELIDGVEAWAISGDSVYSHWAFADRYDFEFPLLADSDGSVARSYDVCYDEWEGHRNVPKRAVIVVDADQHVRYRWVTDKAYESPAFEPVVEAVHALPGVDDTTVPDQDADDGDTSPMGAPLSPAEEGQDE